MNKKLLTCLLALTLICALAFSASADVIPPEFDDSSYPSEGEYVIEYDELDDDTESYDTEDETVLLYDAAEVTANETEPEKSVVKSLLICAVIGIVIALIATLSVKSGYKAVHRKRDAAQYLVDGSLRVTAANERFVRSEISERTIQQNQNQSGSNS